MITDTAVRQKVVAFVPVLAISSPFRMYRSEHEHIVRKPEVKKDKAVEKLKQLYRKHSTKNPDFEMPIDTAYNRRADSLKNHRYSIADIEKFSIALAEFQEEAGFSKKAGIFLSALINNGKDNDYVIHTRHLNIPINSLGYKNTKNITVEGDGGDFVGEKSQGGTITVKGNVDNSIGYHMESGIIAVEGNAYDYAGTGMKGGEIHIEGEITSISNSVIHGKIFHRGKLIEDK